LMLVCRCLWGRLWTNTFEVIPNEPSGSYHSPKSLFVTLLEVIACHRSRCMYYLSNLFFRFTKKSKIMCQAFKMTPVQLDEKSWNHWGKPLSFNIPSLSHPFPPTRKKKENV
jgi:hypothetical protein